MLLNGVTVLQLCHQQQDHLVHRLSIYNGCHQASRPDLFGKVGGFHAIVVLPCGESQ